MIIKRVSRVLVAAIVAVAPLIGLASPAVAAEGDFIVDGGGWGHGVGMSQYGAYGMAKEGSSVADIIGHYYNGAELEDAHELSTVPAWVFDDESLAVNVASKRTSLDLRVRSGSIAVCHRGDGTDDCAGDPPDLVVAANETLRVVGGGDSCIRSKLGANGLVVEGSDMAGSCWFDVTWDDEFANPSLAETLIDVEELTYARGPFEIRPHVGAATFDVTVKLGLEEYLYGIAEMPAGWSLEALKAQAVAARGFAVATAAARGGVDGSGRLADCGCHLRRTPADQNYDAFVQEQADFPFLKWHQAVDETASEVVVHPSQPTVVATTYYSSSTGGSTEDVENVFGGEPLAHLKAQDDHWAIDPSINNPYASWSKSVTKSAVASWLGWDEVRVMALIAGPPGSVVRVEGVNGGAAVSSEKTGWQVRQALGLLSPYISAITREGPPPPPFTDIDTSVHYDDIAYIWRADVTKGCNPPDNTLYCPHEAVTRQQMASFLVRALDLPPASEDQFVDDAASVHQGDINALAASGVTKGCNPPDNDRFCPERSVTRGEMAAFLVRAYSYTDAGAGDLFTDDNGSVFESDIDRLATAGVTKGCNPPDNTRFCPESPVTREQMASFLARAMRAAES